MFDAFRDSARPSAARIPIAAGTASAAPEAPHANASWAQRHLFALHAALAMIQAVHRLSSEQPAPRLLLVTCGAVAASLFEDLPVAAHATRG